MLCFQVGDALKVDEKNPHALCMLADLELKSDGWVKAKDTIRAAKDATGGKDSYSNLALVIFYILEDSNLSLQSILLIVTEK